MDKDEDLINERSGGVSAIFWAILEGRVAVLDELITRDVNLLLTDHSGYIPLEVAIVRADVKELEENFNEEGKTRRLVIIERLLAADDEKETINHVQDPDGYPPETPLDKAILFNGNYGIDAHKDSQRIIKILKEAGAKTYNELTL